jgi:hypothetical protein
MLEPAMCKRRLPIAGALLELSAPYFPVWESATSPLMTDLLGLGCVIGHSDRRDARPTSLDAG